MVWFPFFCAFPSFLIQQDGFQSLNALFHARKSRIYLLDHFGFLGLIACGLAAAKEFDGQKNRPRDDGKHKHDTSEYDGYDDDFFHFGLYLGLIILI